MNLFKKNKSIEEENRLRLQKLVDATIVSEVPDGWIKETFAVGGLTEIGFSKNHSELLLIVSSQGRGVIDCSKLELINRDYNTDHDWMNPHELWSFGIGKLSNEKIVVAGLDGGGLPLSNKDGDGIVFMATKWPIVDLIFQPNFKSIYTQGEASKCFRLFHDYELRAFGFSYNGKYFTIATSSEVHVYRKE